MFALPVDPRVVEAYEKQTDSFQKAAPLVTMARVKRLFFRIAGGALKRGYNVLIFDGPGHFNVAETDTWPPPTARTLNVTQLLCVSQEVFGARLYPARIASCSVMYLPLRVVP